MPFLDALYRKLEAAAHPGYYQSTDAMLPGVENRLGVPMGVVRSAARDILRSGNERAFLEEVLGGSPLTEHEVILVTGLVIAGAARMDFSERLEAARRYIPSIRNWASCDTFAEGFHAFRKHREEGRAFIRELTASRDDWRIRIALVLVLAHFVSDEAEKGFLWEVFESPEVLESAARAYYVSMGLAWGIQAAYVADPETTADRLEALLTGEKIDPVTARRALQKVRDSCRVRPGEKQALTARFSPILRPRKGPTPSNARP